MSNAQAEKMKLSSMDIAEEKRAQLKQLLQGLLPEAVNESGIDFDQLKRALGEWIEPGKERFGLQWPGKAECMKIVQQPSVATLKPARDESVNFDETENLLIEGDNLEVLKLLQKPYFGKVKMIYIDPPYNTGNDFIYPDDYSETLDTYLEYTGQKDENGRRLSTNTDASGRYHSRWLNMMYPRLYLARNLLREDGVIFVSIDDNELHHLRSLCDLIFGEENFIGIFIVNSSPSAIDYGHIAKTHDYALFYAKNIDAANTRHLEEEDKQFKYNDDTGAFNIYPLYNGNVAFNPKTRPNLYYPFYLNTKVKLDNDFFEIGLEEKPGWEKVWPVVSKKDGIARVWRWGKAKALENLNKEIVGYQTEDGEYRIVQKTRLTGKVIRSLHDDKEISSRRGTADFEALLDGKLFPFPKPVELIRRFIAVSTEEDDIILDFFAGSATTAHATMVQNVRDSGKRKFICVQLPEKIQENSPAFSAGYHIISDISKERIRRAAKKITEDANGQLDLNDSGNLDLGFKVFKLDRSNFKLWDGSVDQSAELEKQLSLHVDHIAKASTPEDILYELLLKAGFPLTTKVEKVKMAGKEVFSIHEGALLICLEKELTQQLIDALAEANPVQVICLDEGFNGNDQLKANAVQTFKARAQAEESEIVFRTV